MALFKGVVSLCLDVKYKSDVSLKMFNDYFVTITTAQVDPLSSAIFREVIAKVEKLSKFIPLAFNYTACSVMLPPLVIISYRYFTTGLESDDYQLPIHEW